VDVSSSLVPRKPTRQISVGNVKVGGDAPITVQSMTITKTADVEGTLQQIYALAAAGADIVRCTCNETEAAEGLAQIVPARRCRSSPTSTTSTRWRSLRWRPVCTACV
jgi:(E)-4-hydroxy-3-methylbut-2-enyl-diphosphate synthase